MRFGKKLALQVTADQSGAPYLSHKAMKEAINRTVRELRLYQSKSQNYEAWQNGNILPEGEAATPRELAEIEGSIVALDQQLFTLVDDDLRRIFAHVRKTEQQLGQGLSDLQNLAIQMGALVEEEQLNRLERTLPSAPESRAALCEKLLELRIKSNPSCMAEQLEDLVTQYNNFVEQSNEHLQYLEINVAGFRKLLKRHEKQIPQHFHARRMPFLDFHCLVTHTSRQLAKLVVQFGGIVGDTKRRLEADVAHAHQEVAKQVSQIPDIQELRGLGPECAMVLEIQKQIKDPMNSQLLRMAAGMNGAAPAGLLYPKPGNQVPSAGMALTQGHATAMVNDPSDLNVQSSWDTSRQRQDQQSAMVKWK